MSTYQRANAPAEISVTIVKLPVNFWIVAAKTVIANGIWNEKNSTTAADIITAKRIWNFWLEVSDESEALVKGLRTSFLQIGLKPKVEKIN